MLRFSLRWLLAAVAFVALAITALVNPAPLWASLILLVASCLFLWSLLAVVVWRGQRQAAAVGFALFGTVYLLGVWALGGSFPVTQFLHQLRPQALSSDEEFDEVESTLARLYDERDRHTLKGPQYDRNSDAIELYSRVLNRHRANGAFLQSGHAVCMVVFGWLGWISGTLVYAQRKDSRGHKITSPTGD